MSDATFVAVDRHERAAERILERIMHRQNWTAKTRDAIASVIAREVLDATNELKAENTDLRHERGVLARRLHLMGYDGPMEVGRYKRTHKLRAMAERAKA